jgi:hypothetical protein
LWLLASAAVLIVVALAERERYASARPGEPPDETAADGLRATDEVFDDPTTGRRTRVWFDPHTGRRAYRPDTSPRA